MEERTAHSGVRDVAMKTSFPGFTRVLLNEPVLYPLHLVQKAARKSPRALVLYAEAIPGRAGSVARPQPSDLTVSADRE